MEARLDRSWSIPRTTLDQGVCTVGESREDQRRTLDSELIIDP